MGTEDNKAVVKKFLESFSKAGSDEYLNAMTSDAIWWINGKKELFEGAGTYNRQEFSELMQWLRTIVPAGIPLIPHLMVAEGDKVVVEATANATTTAGKKYAGEYLMLFTLESGKIKSVREYFDPQHATVVFRS